jgi:UDPglucose 6-dehydrogenase
MTSPVIGFAGMTHLGLNSAVASAEKGFELVCFDLDANLIARLKLQELPVNEPELPEMLARNAERITFTTAIEDLVACDVVYVAPDVATNDQGESDLSYVSELIVQVEAALRDDAIMVLLSQVPPGYTRARERNGEILYYQVETLIFGRAIERALYPERFIIGCADPGKPLPAAYATYLESFGCPLLQMRYESAELAKISINCCLIASVTVANTLAEVCEHIGADWAEIAPALKLDRRIGANSYLTPGMGISGGNLERDLATVDRLSRTTGTEAGLITAFQRNSAHRKMWALRVLHQTTLDVNPEAVIGVLGLTYKENTHSLKNSPSAALLVHLHPWRVRLFDPIVPASAAQHPRSEGCSSAIEVATGADALVLMTPWPEFRDLDPVKVAKVMHGRVLIDPHRLIDPAKAMAAGLEYVTLGTVYA